MKAIAFTVFAGSLICLVLALLMNSRGPLDVTLLDYYFVLLPRYFVVGAAVLFIAGSALIAAHRQD